MCSTGNRPTLLIAPSCIDASGATSCKRLGQFRKINGRSGLTYMVKEMGQEGVCGIMCLEK